MPEEPASQQADGQGQGQVWGELFSTVAQLGETVELSLQAFSPDASGDKVSTSWAE